MTDATIIALIKALGGMSSEDKTKLDTLWEDYSSALTALGVDE